MKRAAFAALAMMALSSRQGEAATSPRFDLVCQSRSGEPVKFRFDLARRKWCINRCAAVWPIDRLSDSTIRLVTYSSDSRLKWTISIDRYRSTFSAVHRGYGDAPADGGVCRTAPFSGFPARKF